MVAAMETFCSQAYGAKKYSTVGVVLQRALLITTLFNLCCISIWWKVRGGAEWAGEGARGAEGCVLVSLHPRDTPLVSLLRPPPLTSYVPCAHTAHLPHTYMFTLFVPRTRPVPTNVPAPTNPYFIHSHHTIPHVRAAAVAP